MELNTNHPLKRASVNGLAVVGFVALVFAGMTLAVYAARFIPTAVSQIASASVYLSSFFNGTTENTLEVVPGDTQTPAVTLPIADTTKAPETATETKPTPTPTQGPKSDTTYVLGGGTGTVSTGTLTGLSDLSVHIIATGYLDTKGVTESFIPAKTVPAGKQGAVKFTVTNVGTNITGTWKFKADLPTSPSYTFHSQDQKSLAPGEHIDFTLGFDRGREGTDQEIDITLDPDKSISEISEQNNEETILVTIER